MLKQDQIWQVFDVERQEDLLQQHEQMEQKVTSNEMSLSYIPAPKTEL